MKTAAPLISVVIPVYNAQKYLAQCLECVIAQTYENLEIIVVNDGSTDGSPDICREYAARDDRIKVYNRTNQGVSAARNFAMEHAHGELLCFADSDDFCSPDMAERLAEPFLTDAGCDISICGISCVDEAGRKTGEMTSADGRYTTQEYLDKVFIKWKIQTYVGAPYAKMFRMSVIRENPVRFDTGMTYAEDFMFNTLALRYAGYVNIIEEPLYSYRQGLSTSLTCYNETVMPSGEYWRQRLAVYKSLADIYREYGLYEKYGAEIAEILKIYIIESERYIMRDGRLGRAEKVSLVKKMRDDAEVESCVKSGYNGKAMNRIRMFLFKHRRIQVLHFAERVLKALNPTR